MFFGIALSAAAIYGMIIGIRTKRKALSIGSFLLLVFVIAVWIYFYKNPY